MYIKNTPENLNRLRESGVFFDLPSIEAPVWEIPNSDTAVRLLEKAGFTQEDIAIGQKAADSTPDADVSDDTPAVSINDGDDVCEDCGAEPGCAHTGDCPQAQDDGDGDPDEDADAQEGEDTADLDTNIAPPVQKKTSNQNVAKLEVLRPTFSQSQRESEQRVRELVASGLSLEDARESVLHEDIAEAIGVAVPRKTYDAGRRFRENLKPLHRKRESLLDLNLFDGEATGQSDEEARVAATVSFLEESAAKAKRSGKLREARVISRIIKRLTYANEKLIKLNCLRPLE